LEWCTNLVCLLDSSPILYGWFFSAERWSGRLFCLQAGFQQQIQYQLSFIAFHLSVLLKPWTSIYLGGQDRCRNQRHRVFVFLVHNSSDREFFILGKARYSNYPNLAAFGPILVTTSPSQAVFRILLALTQM
jgi:hypothetical protein